MALVKYSNWAVDEVGNVIPSAAVEVRARDGADPITIYSDASGSAQSNPYTAETDGSFTFWAPQGEYDLLVGPDGSPATLPITLIDPGQSFYTTRAAAVAFVTSEAFAGMDDGAVFYASGFSYEKQTGATIFADMPDVTFHNKLFVDHFAENLTPGTTDMTTAIESAFAYGGANGVMVNMRGDYGMTNVDLTLANGDFIFPNYGGWRFVQLSGRDEGVTIVTVGGVVVAEGRAFSATSASGSNTFEIDDATDVSVGDLISAKTNLLFEGDHRFLATNCLHQVNKVKSISGTTVTTVDPFVWDMNVSTLSAGTAQSGASNEIVLDASDTSRRADIRNRTITITAGAGTGQTKYIHDYDEATKTVTLGTDYSSFPQDDWDINPNNTSVYEIRETVSVDIYRPANVSGRIYAAGYAENNVNVQGVKLQYADDHAVTGGHISGCSNHAIYTWWCYRGNLDGVVLEGANYAYGSGSGRGYGHEDYGSFKTMVNNCVAVNCRTGFDAVQGSYGLVRRNNTVIGGGDTYQGDPFWPNGTQSNSGFSSHTGAWGVYDSGNTSYNVFFHKMRGGHTVNGDSTFGQADGVYRQFWTKYASVTNCTYIDDYSDFPLTTNSEFQPGDRGDDPDVIGDYKALRYPASNPQSPSDFVRILQDTLPEGAAIINSHNTAIGITDRFEWVINPDPTSDLRHEVVGNSGTIVKPLTGTATVAIVESTSTDDVPNPLSFGSLTCHGNDFTWGGSALGEVGYGKIDSYPIFDNLVTGNTIIDLGGGLFGFKVADQGAVVSATLSKRRLGGIFAAYAADAPQSHYIYGMMAHGVGASNGMIDTAGSAGATFVAGDTLIGPGEPPDGNMILSARDDGRIMLVNRTGSDRLFILETGPRI